MCVLTTGKTEVVSTSLVGKPAESDRVTVKVFVMYAVDERVVVLWISTPGVAGMSLRFVSTFS